MPALYCLNCGSKNSFVSSKPASCAKCNNPFAQVAASTKPFIPAQASNRVSQPKAVDPAIERKRALLAERRGSRSEKGLKNTSVEPIDADEDSWDEDSFDDNVSVSRPKKFIAEISIDKPMSIGSLGDYLRTVEPKESNE